MPYCPIDVIAVKPLSNYRLHLQFEDGCDGDVDISKLIPFEGVFAPLEDKTFFSKVSVNPDIGTICWENGADLSPIFLYKQISK